MGSLKFNSNVLGRVSEGEEKANESRSDGSKVDEQDGKDTENYTLGHRMLTISRRLC